MSTIFFHAPALAVCAMWCARIASSPRLPCDGRDTFARFDDIDVAIRHFVNGYVQASKANARAYNERYPHHEQMAPVTASQVWADMPASVPEMVMFDTFPLHMLPYNCDGYQNETDSAFFRLTSQCMAIGTRRQIKYGSSFGPVQAPVAPVGGPTLGVFLQLRQVEPANDNQT